MIKKCFFALCAGFCTLSYGFEIQDRQVFDAKIAPTKMSATLTYTVFAPSAMAAKAPLDSLLAEAKVSHKSCHGGEYYVYPLLNYDKNGNKSGILGYEGNIRFECAFTDVAVYDKFLEFVSSNIKDKNRQKIHIGQIRWEITDAERDLAVERLKLKALEGVQKRGMELSRASRSVCELKKISFEGGDSSSYPVMLRAAMPQTQTPIPEAKEVTLIADISFDCKR